MDSEKKSDNNSGSRNGEQGARNSAVVLKDELTVVASGDDDDDHNDQIVVVDEIIPAPPVLTRYTTQDNVCFQRLSTPGAVAMPGNLERSLSAGDLSVNYRMGSASFPPVEHYSRGRSSGWSSSVALSPCISDRRSSLIWGSHSPSVFSAHGYEEQSVVLMVAAEVVGDHHHNSTIPTAIHVVDTMATNSNNSNSNSSVVTIDPSCQRSSPHFRRNIFILLLTMLFGLVIITVSVAMLSKGSSPLSSAQPPSQSPNDPDDKNQNSTSPNNTSNESNQQTPMSALRSLLIPISGASALNNMSSPQYAALLWLVQENEAIWSSNYIHNNDTTATVPTREEFSSTLSLPSTSLIERYILAVFYYSTKGPTHWQNPSQFLTPNSVCSWHNGTDSNGVPLGVTCMNITAITTTSSNDVGRNNLSNTATMRGLTINLGSNNLAGTLPGELWYLSNLIFLYLCSNQITGTLPSSLSLTPFPSNGNGPSGNSSITNTTTTTTSFWPLLDTLDLSVNSFHGTIPRELFMLSSLRSLILHHNELTGSLPTVVESNTTKLLLPPQVKFIDLSVNRLGGSIPSDIHVTTSNNTNQNQDLSLSSLESLSLSNNDLSGIFPSQLLWLLPQLNSLDLSNNFLYGTVFYGVDNYGGGDIVTLENGFSNLAHLRISRNNLTGTISGDVLNVLKLTNLNELDLSYNRIYVSSLSGIGNMTNLQKLDLANNILSGTIPTEIGMLTRLTWLQLDHMYNSGGLTGSIPNEIGLLTALTVLRLSCNRLAGSIPDSLFQNMTNLQELYLDDNGWLNGTIPTDVSQLVQLKHLNISWNTLSGSIPSQLGNKAHLQSLDMSNNRFSGMIVSEMFLLPSLVILDMSFNHLTGMIPPALGLLQLVSLNLRNNSFRGTLPVPKSWTQLEYFDVGCNDFTGTIPSQYDQITDLFSLELDGNMLQGTIPDFFCPSNLPHLANLLLQNNNVTGNLTLCFCNGTSTLVPDMNIWVDCSKVDCECCRCS